MDKYEFNIKVEQIKKLVNKGDFETAMKIADTIDWRRVRSTSLLTMISQIYEKNAEYQDAKDILLLAYERAPLGKGLLYKLTDLALRENNIQEAEAYYREFCELSGDDPRQYLLRFLILEAKDAPLEQQINSLERYCQEELDEKWLYHLAELYHQANQADDCVRICDKIMLMFGLGKYVDKAMELKLQYAPLTKYQMDLVENREKYEEKLRAVEEEYKNGTYRKPEPEGEYLDTDEPEAELDDEPENEPEGQPEQAEPEEKAGKPKAETKPADEKVEKAALDEDVVASLHEAQAEEALAKEVSKIKPYDEEEGASEGETRVFRNLRDLEPAEAEEKSEEAPIHEFEEEEETIVEDWDFEPEEEEEEIKESNHLMIEAEDPAAGLAMALDSLKKIHRELGTKHPVAKISGANLSHRGIASVAERLAGKDLVVEHAADLDDLTVEELEELIAACEKREIVVMMDLVLNHSSHLHPWFLEARKDRNSKYHDFYIWKEGTKEQPPEGGGAFFGGSTWEWVPEVQEYYYHSFSVMQPDLNWKNPSLRKELYRMIQFWMDKGIRGFRLDAIDNIVKDGHGGNDTHSEQIHTYLMEMNQNTYGKSEQILTVGETGGATVEMAQQYSDPESQELSMIFQFELMGIDGIRSGNWDPKPYTLPQLKQLFEKWQTGLEEKGWNSLFWGNHDFPRVVSRFGNDREPYREKSAKMLAVLLHGMKGTPYIYQGEEIGMTNVSGLRIEDYQDIESVNFAEDRKKEGWEEEKIRTYLARNSRDHARTPMQWNAEKHAGFTAGTPWMAENQNYAEINVENSRKNPDSLFYFYQKLIALRRKNDTLVYGDFRLIEEENPDIFAYERNLGEKKLIVLCNFRDTAAEMKARYDLTKGTVLIHNDTESLTKEVWKLQPYEAYMIELLQ